MGGRVAPMHCCSGAPQNRACKFPRTRLKQAARAASLAEALVDRHRRAGASGRNECLRGGCGPCPGASPSGFVGLQRVLGDRLTDGSLPLLPLVWMRWFLVDMQKVVPAQGASCAWLPEQTHDVIAEQRTVSATPSGPVVDQH